MSVTTAQIAAAQAHGLVNVDALASACDRHRVPFYLACTILDKETDGRNIFGHDRGGAFCDPHGKDIEVTRARYRKFRALLRAGHTSNGVGPMQITWSGFFPDMESQGLEPWVAGDNIAYGVSILARTWAATQSVARTAKAYNGGDAYAQDAVRLAKTWRQRVGDDDVRQHWSQDHPGVRHSDAYDCDYQWFGVVNGQGGGWVTPVDADILTAVQGGAWGRIRLSQGGLSSSEPRSPKTNCGLGAWDIAIDGRSRARVWQLCRRLLRSGVVAFPRGYGDDVSPRHIHCVSRESLHHTHPEAQQQLTSYVFGYLHTVMGRRGAGLPGAKWRRYIGPRTPLERWVDSPYNPANISADTHTYYVDVEPGSRLFGLNVDQRPIKTRERGFAVVAAQQVRRWGRQNVVTRAGTFYALDNLSRRNPLAAATTTPALGQAA